MIYLNIISNIQFILKFKDHTRWNYNTGGNNCHHIRCKLLTQGHNILTLMKLSQLIMNKEITNILFIQQTLGKTNWNTIKKMSEWILDKDLIGYSILKATLINENLL